MPAFRHRWRLIAATVLTLVCAGFIAGQLYSGPPRATQSSPIGITPDDKYVWVANPDVNSVSLLEVGDDRFRKLAEVAVGEEPTNVAVHPNGRWVYVANTASGYISVIDGNPEAPSVFTNIWVGTEPYGLALTPNGRYLYVANARSNDVSVIDTAENRIVCTVYNAGPEPRGIAITNDGDDDDRDEKVYVTQFLGTDRVGVLIGADDYKEGRITVLSTSTHSFAKEISLAPLADTGFRSNGSALQRTPQPTPAVFDTVTAAFPNQLNSVAIYGNRAYFPNTGASPDGPVRFNVNLQALVSVIDTERDAEVADQTFNMNRGINFEPTGPRKIFPSSPWHIAFKRSVREGYVVSAGSNLLVKMVLDDNGKPTINAPAGSNDPGNIVRIEVGQNPRGLVINSRDDRAYVMNEVSRDVSVVDLNSNQVISTVRSADLPAAGSQAAKVLLGKALFNTSRGVKLPELGPEGTVGERMSSEGWSSCFACHPFGLTDGVVWIFAAGPRRTIQMNWTFAPKDPNDPKILNHSAIFDEVQDFELNIRGVSGGLGLITGADGAPATDVTAFGPPANTGRSVHHDAIALYAALGIRTPISPYRGIDPNSPQGRMLAYGRTMFDRAGCATCHAGRGWTSARRFLPLPVPASEIVRAQVLRYLRDVGTFDATARNEIRATGLAPLGADGYVPASLLGGFGMGPYLHNGSALTLDNVLENVKHRSAGNRGTDILQDARDRQALVEFLKSIDVNTPVFDVR